MNRAKSYTRTIASACMSLILTMCVLCFTAYAAAATFNVNVPPTNVAPGDTVEISVNMLGLSILHLDQTHNQVFHGSRNTTSVNFRVNVLSVGVGLYYYL